MESALDYQTARALLEWQVELGATEAMLDEPLDRYEAPVKAEKPKPAPAVEAPRKPSNAVDPVQVATQAAQAALEVAQMTAEIVKGEAVNRCPLETSQTRNSGTVTELEAGAEISFNTPQAAWLHESQN